MDKQDKQQKQQEKPQERPTIIKQEKQPDKQQEKIQEKPLQKQPEKIQERPQEKPLQKQQDKPQQKHQHKPQEKTHERLQHNQQKIAINTWYKGLSEKDKQEARVLSQISLWLDSYDDIFSDFDPRPNSQRSISDDFVSEAKKAAKDKETGSFELKLLVPDKKRDKHEEKIIKKRLKHHFRKQAYLARKELNKTRNEGIFFLILGITLMFFASPVLFLQEDKNFLLSFLVILLEPAGWFTFWEGMNSMIFRPRTHKPELEFAQKMAKCGINFISY